MTKDDFIELVRVMRQAQKDYFKSRHLDNLKKSKQLESQVDQGLRELQGLPL